MGYGSNDCSLLAADWVLEQTGRDPAALWRGRYSDQAGAFAFIKHNGGMLRMFAKAAASVGLERSDEGSPGDVGVIFRREVRGRSVGGICLGGGFWTAVGQGGGLWIGRTHALRAWSVS